MSEPEAVIQAKIRLAVGKAMRAIRLFRNNCGVAHHADGSRVVYGLAPGSSDLIGLVPVLIGPEHVGRRLAVFAAVEVKRPGQAATPQQINFLEMVQQAGGVAGIAHSPEEAIALLQAPVGVAP
jgi:hypothetical protein